LVSNPPFWISLELEVCFIPSDSQI
jgi:hypothetical protein